MPTEVTRGVELRRELLVDASVAAESGVVVAGADELLVAVGGLELLALLALAVPARNLLVEELAIGVAVRDARVLGPDAAVDDSDDHVLARAAGLLGAAGAAELVPQSVGVGEAEERRRRGGVEGESLVGRDGQHVGQSGHLGGRGRREPSREAVERVGVAVDLGPAAGPIQGRVVLATEVTDVSPNLRARRVDLLALPGLRGPQSADSAVVTDHGRLGELHDVGARLELLLLGRRARRLRHLRSRCRCHDRGREARCHQDSGGREGQPCASTV